MNTGGVESSGGQYALNASLLFTCCQDGDLRVVMNASGEVARDETVVSIHEN